MRNRPIFVCFCIAVLLHVLIAYAYFSIKPLTQKVAVERPRGVAVRLDSLALQNLIVAEKQRKEASKKVNVSSKKGKKKKIIKKVIRKPNPHKPIVKPVLVKAKVNVTEPQKTVYSAQKKKIEKNALVHPSKQTVEKSQSTVQLTEEGTKETLKKSDNRQAIKKVTAYTSAHAGKSIPAAKEIGHSQNQKLIEMNGEMRRYLAQVMRHLIKYKQYPASLKKEHIEGKPVVRFSINAKGKVTIAEVKKSSGSQALDAAAVAVFQKASPLPKIPKSMSRDKLTMSLPIEYSLIND